LLAQLFVWLSQFLVLAAGGIFLLGSGEFLVWLSPFLLLRWWQVGDGFVVLVRLKLFLSRWARTTFVSDFRIRGLLLGFRSFLLERHGGKFFVELAPFIVLFHVGLDFCFVSHVGLARLFVGVWSGSLGVLRPTPVFFFECRCVDNGVELARLIILFEVVRACATFCLAYTRF
jgi:hypothetical protein